MNERTMTRFYGPSGYVPPQPETNHELTREPRITLDEITVLQTELMRFASSNFHGMRDWYVKISEALGSQGFDNVDLARERDEYKRKYEEAQKTAHELTREDVHTQLTALAIQGGNEFSRRTAADLDAAYSALCAQRDALKEQLDSQKTKAAERRANCIKYYEQQVADLTRKLEGGKG